MVRSILIVDDDADTRLTLQALLEMEGYQVAAAPDGNSAVEIQQSRPADVLITDLFMPKRDGFETLSDFRSAWPATRIIVISGGVGKTRHDYLESARLIGVEATFQKPFDPASLVALLKEM
jgi:CheY-like chemotaxis protein